MIGFLLLGVKVSVSVCEVEKSCSYRSIAKPLDCKSATLLLYRSYKIPVIKFEIFKSPTPKSGISPPVVLCMAAGARAARQAEVILNNLCLFETSTQDWVVKIN